MAWLPHAKKEYHNYTMGDIIMRPESATADVPSDIPWLKICLAELYSTCAAGPVPWHAPLHPAPSADKTGASRMASIA